MMTVALTVMMAIMVMMMMIDDHDYDAFDDDGKGSDAALKTKKMMLTYPSPQSDKVSEQFQWIYAEIPDKSTAVDWKLTRRWWQRSVDASTLAMIATELIPVIL